MIRTWRGGFFFNSQLVAIGALATALELTLTGREVTAEEAYRVRLVTKVVPHEKLMATAEQYGSLIMGNSQQAIRSAKETILDGGSHLG